MHNTPEDYLVPAKSFEDSHGLCFVFRYTIPATPQKAAAAVGEINLG